MTNLLSMIAWIPLLPLAAAAILALTPSRCRRWAAPLSIGALSIGFLLSCAAMAGLSSVPGMQGTQNFTWFEFGGTAFRIGWILDPLSAVMLTMVTLVGTCIFVFSAGYMEHDANFTRFFCFLSLFAAAMLGVVMSNNLLMLFACWEVMGAASYLLIGFWHQKPAAAAAARKAFITTRIGDLGFLWGLLWLYSETGTLLFYDGGAGCLESSAVAGLAGKAIGAGMVASTGISLLIFCGAIGKSGQLPLHVWLPDAMEGPTPVSALIHAATMVAAGVFLMARLDPIVSAPAALPPAALMQVSDRAPAGEEAHPPPAPDASKAERGEPSVPGSHESGPVSTGRQAMAWVGALTALFAALVATSQHDIKRILAYSTMSQLGYMFLGLATGGVAAGMFHLITHAFFKALLFLGAGSIIHGCHGEQDIRRMGGLRRWMPLTFATYAVGMMALSGFPLLFSGFWSKDEILHASLLWEPSKWPFALALAGTLVTAFYMTRQMIYLFPGPHRGLATPPDTQGAIHPVTPHESPSSMTLPMVVLAACTVLLSLVGTPAWPWFHDWMAGHPTAFHSEIPLGGLMVMLLSSGVVAVGVGLGCWIYLGRRQSLDGTDPLQPLIPDTYRVLQGRFFIDELYAMSWTRWYGGVARFCDALDRRVVESAVEWVRLGVLGLAWGIRLWDDFIIRLGFRRGCDGLELGGRLLSLAHNGHLHRFLRVLAVSLAGLALWLLWR